MIEINLSLLIQMANFLVFLLLMNLVLYRPIRRIVATEKDDARSRKGSSASMRRRSPRCRNTTARFRNRGERSSEGPGAQGGGLRGGKELLRTISEEAAQQLQKMRAQIQKDISAARDQLREQVRSFSVQLAQKILGRSI